MKYIQLKIETSKSGIEILAAELMELGIEDLLIEDPSDISEMLAGKQPSEYSDPGEFDSALNEVPSITIYFDDSENGCAMADRAQHAVEVLAEECAHGSFGAGTDPGSLSVTRTITDDSEWKNKWKEYLEPVNIGESIIVKPSWIDLVSASDETVISIDPGMAFGTGAHETTVLSGGLLEKYMKRGDRVMDVGCGTGILSIMAEKLGASDVLGIDIDSDAVRTANENIAANGSAETAKAVYGDLTKGIEYVADVVVANLLAGLVMELTEDVVRNLADGGIYISSGILIEQKMKVCSCLAASGFEIMETADMGEWCGIAARFTGC